MDLFTLVARLTLDDKEYEKALKDAEKTGKKAKLDAKGTLTATDHYTQGLNQAQNAARNFHGNATGTISAVDHYSDAIDTAAAKGRAFNPNAKDDIDAGTDHYSAALDAATQKASEFEPDASDDIDVGTDHYAAAMEADTTAAGDFEPGAEGTIGLTEDQFATAMSDDETKASEFSPAPSGDIALGSDDFAAAMTADETNASTFDPQASGTIGVTDDYDEALTADINKASDAALGAEGTITGTDDYSDDAGTAQAEHDALNLDASGTLSIQTAEYETALENAGTASTGFGGQMDTMISGISNKLAAAGIVGAVVAIGQAFSDAVMEAANYADTVDKGAQAMNINTDEYQKWRYALGQSGATMSHFTRGVQNLNAAMNGEGTEEVVDALNDLHIDPTQFSSTEEALDAVVTALAGMEAGSDRDLLVTKIFGRQGTQLNALLNSGAEGIKELKQNAVELGLVMSGEDISEGVKFGDSLSDMNQAVDALERDISSNLFPLLTDAVQMVTSIVSFLRGGDGNIETWFSDIDDEMKRAFAQVDHDETATNGLIQTLKEMSDETGHCKDNLEKWKGVAERLIELCPTLAGQIDLVTGSYNEQNGSLEENARLYFRAARQRAYLKAVEEKENALTKAAQNLASKEIDLTLAKNDEAAYREQLRTGFYNALLSTGQSSRETLDNMSMTELRQAYIYADTTGLISEENKFDYGNQFSGLWADWQNASTRATVAAQSYNTASRELAVAQQQFEEFSATVERILARMDEEERVYTLEDVQTSLPGDQEQWYQNMFAAYEKGMSRELTNAEKSYLIRKAILGGGLSGSIFSDEGFADLLANAFTDIDESLYTEEGGRTILGYSAIEEMLRDTGGTLSAGSMDVTTGNAAITAGTVTVAGGDADGSHAKGLWSVPYDDYTARLHRDEMVLTASQARDYRDGMMGDGTAIVAAIEGLRNDMQNLKLVVGRKAFGQATVDYGGRRMQGYIGQAENRAIAGYGWG